MRPGAHPDWQRLCELEGAEISGILPNGGNFPPPASGRNSPPGNSRSHVDDVLEAINKARAVSSRSAVTAKYPGTCAECGQPIDVGDVIAWRKNAVTLHARCWRGEIT